MLNQISVQQLKHLVEILELLDDVDYIQPMEDIYNSTVGKHTRHIIEFYQLFHKGYSKKILCYDKRKRSKKLEINKEEAIKSLKKVIKKLKKIPHEKDLILKVTLNEESHFMPTTVARELLYLSEHTTHHLALIRLGIANIRPDIETIPAIGIAYSTPDK